MTSKLIIIMMIIIIIIMIIMGHNSSDKHGAEVLQQSTVASKSTFPRALHRTQTLLPFKGLDGLLCPADRHRLSCQVGPGGAYLRINLSALGKEINQAQSLLQMCKDLQPRRSACHMA